MHNSLLKIPVTLATQSKARIAMFKNAGFQVATQSADIDELAIKSQLLADGATPEKIAAVLADEKARLISDHTSGFVIGADQVLECDGKLYDKVSNMDAARQKLRALQGQAHRLISAAAIYEDGQPVWKVAGQAQLFMRDMSDTEIEDYLSLEGEAILSSVGCYFLEGRGATLFTSIQGDYFVVLGFPLLDVLGYLRERSVI